MENIPKLEVSHIPEKLFKKAINWAQEQAYIALEKGTPLSDLEIKAAKKVGVEHPELVRVVEIESIPLPNDPELKAAAETTGLLNPNITGITFDHSIYILKGHRTLRLMSHELRHVYQYESAKSVKNFLATYLQQLLSVGYSQASLEIDARNHEQ